MTSESEKPSYRKLVMVKCDIDPDSIDRKLFYIESDVISREH